MDHNIMTLEEARKLGLIDEDQLCQHCEDGDCTSKCKEQYSTEEMDKR
jgi:hypothetical protein